MLAGLSRVEAAGIFRFSLQSLWSNRNFSFTFNDLCVRIKEVYCGFSWNRVIYTLCTGSNCLFYLPSECRLRLRALLGSS